MTIKWNPSDVPMPAEPGIYVVGEGAFLFAVTILVFAFVGFCFLLKAFLIDWQRTNEAIAKVPQKFKQ